MLELNSLKVPSNEHLDDRKRRACQDGSREDFVRIVSVLDVSKNEFLIAQRVD